MFYKLENSNLAYSNQVFGPTTLVAEDKDIYSYPVDGWYWFDTLEDAIQGMNLQITGSGTPITPTPDTSSCITRLAFRNRFTVPEKVALYTAANSNVQIKIYLDDISSATFVDLSRSDTREGVQALETAGLLAAGRALIILDTPPTVLETYTGS